MIRVFSLPQNYHCPAMKDDYGTVAKINQELDLTSALTLHFIPLSVPLTDCQTCQACTMVVQFF